MGNCSERDIDFSLTSPCELVGQKASRMKRRVIVSGMHKQADGLAETKIKDTIPGYRGSPLGIYPTAILSVSRNDIVSADLG